MTLYQLVAARAQVRQATELADSRCALCRLPDCMTVAEHDDLNDRRARRREEIRAGFDSEPTQWN